MTKKFFSLLIFLFTFFSFVHSQDSTKVSPALKGINRSPRKAMILSAVVPGLGQAYNKKYWKIPIVYAAIGTPLYFVTYNNSFYKKYKQAYINKNLAVDDPQNPYTSLDQIRTLEQSYHKNRDLCVMLTAFGYVLNLADAYVDAHFKTFDVSDNLSMKIYPNLNFSSQKSTTVGLSLSLHF